jgi:hypothetical protein
MKVTSFPGAAWPQVVKENASKTGSPAQADVVLEFIAEATFSRAWQPNGGAPVIRFEWTQIDDA